VVDSLQSRSRFLGARNPRRETGLATRLMSKILAPGAACVQKTN